MASARWFNILLWGLGDRLEGDNDTKSDLLLIVDGMVWVGLFVPALHLTAVQFIVYWLLAPILGAPVYWLVTQLAVGYVLVRAGAIAKSKQSSGSRSRTEERGSPSPQPKKPEAHPASEEP